MPSQPELSFSIIIPVYNRPDELRELLLSLANQTYTSSFELIIVEDGSTISSDQVVASFQEALNIKYFQKPNEGPGPSRNYGIARASGNYLIFFDSDCIIPPQYLEHVHQQLSSNYVDMFGGPDTEHPDFTPVQKAISYSMTSMLTTGGIRGKLKDPAKYHPRSYNMGFSRQVAEATQGFAPMRFGEDLDLSIRTKALGFKTALLPGAWVYHKRRTDFGKFYKQIFNSGIARVHLSCLHPGTLKVIHLFPTAFVLACILATLLPIFCIYFPLYIVVGYLMAIGFDATHRFSSIYLGYLAMQATCVQHFAYGLGFLSGVWHVHIRKDKSYQAYSRTFYK